MSVICKMNGARECDGCKERCESQRDSAETCDNCKEEIYGGEYYYEIDGFTMCQNCIEECRHIA